MVDSKAYIIDGNDELLLIDSSDGEDFKDYIKNKSPKHIKVILTHEHYDHIVGIEWLREYFETEVCSSKIVAENITNSLKNLSKCANVLLSFYEKKENEERIIEPYTCFADSILYENEEFIWEENKIRIISTPGHTSGSICILVNDKILFTGDSLLSIPTITRFPSGSKKDFFDISIAFFESLKEKEIVVMPGHGAPEKLDSLTKNIKVI